MEVILLDDVPGLGNAGDVLKVKDGYARNYLIPFKLAVKLSKAELNRIEQIRKAGEARRLRRIADAKSKISNLDGKSIFVPMKVGSENRLFGAVTTLNIASAIKEQLGVELDRRFIHQSEPFKFLGEFTVDLRAGEEASGKLTVLVVNEETYNAQGPDAALAEIKGEETIKIEKEVSAEEEEASSEEPSSKEPQAQVE